MAPPAPAPAGAARGGPAWGTNWRQRLRLLPLYGSIALADAVPLRARRRAPTDPGANWRKGVSVVIPERDSPELLGTALDSVRAALLEIDEPHQIVVVINGAPLSRYDALRARLAGVDIVHRAAPLGFSAAVHRGLARARHDWTFLMNNDVTLDTPALSRLMRLRAADVFAVAAQIMQKSADGRREETGFTDWYVDADGIHAYHADPGHASEPRPALCASGGASLFRSRLLRRYAAASRCYDPFYWEDMEWGVRAAGDGYRVLFCPAALAHHRHRATTSRFYTPAELERIVERNRLVFDMRNAASGASAAWLLERVCRQPYRTQRELSRLGLALANLRRRSSARSARHGVSPPRLVADPASAAIDITTSSHCFRLRKADDRAAPARPCVLVVSPFAVFPPRHGGARRVSGLLRTLRRDFDIVLVSDEASLHDARSFVHFDGLHAVHLVQRSDAASLSPRSGSLPLGPVMAAHCHDALKRAVARAIRDYRPSLVQVEHVELAPLVSLREHDQRWVLDLHDAVTADDFADTAAALAFERNILARYDAVTVCSPEDAALMAHPRLVCVPNGTEPAVEPYRPSAQAGLLFMGPFRYGPNLEGIRAFLRTAYPRILQSVPQATLVVLGGDGALDRCAPYAEFAQPGVAVKEHREDVATFLGQSALTINPLTGIRGSALKVVESLVAGRVCVSTEEGARGFAASGLDALVRVPDIESMAAAVIRLLTRADERHRLEAPDHARLRAFEWSQSARVAGSLWNALLESP